MPGPWGVICDSVSEDLDGLVNLLNQVLKSSWFSLALNMSAAISKMRAPKRQNSHSFRQNFGRFQFSQPTM